jgi:hypothetical protein
MELAETKDVYTNWKAQISVLDSQMARPGTFTVQQNETHGGYWIEQLNAKVDAIGNFDLKGKAKSRARIVSPKGETFYETGEWLSNHITFNRLQKALGDLKALIAVREKNNNHKKEA